MIEIAICLATRPSPAMPGRSFNHVATSIPENGAEVGNHAMTNLNSHQDPTGDHSVRERDKSRVAARIGIGLILLSGVLWFSLFAIPFLPLTMGQKAALAGAFFVGVQIAWWSGAALAGPQTVSWIKSWFRRRKKTDEL